MNEFSQFHRFANSPLPILDKPKLTAIMTISDPNIHADYSDKEIGGFRLTISSYCNDIIVKSIMKTQIRKFYSLGIKHGKIEQLQSSFNEIEEAAIITNEYIIFPENKDGGLLIRTHNNKFIIRWDASEKGFILFDFYGNQAIFDTASKKWEEIRTAAQVIEDNAFEALQAENSSASDALFALLNAPSFTDSDLEFFCDNMEDLDPLEFPQKFQDLPEFCKLLTKYQDTDFQMKEIIQKL